jgi:uncharacterized membrane protein YuzA (DUF378 family)
MRFLTGAGLLLAIVGAVNWLLVGVARFDLVAAATGDRFGRTNPLSSAVYVLVGVAGLSLIPLLIRRLNGADDTTPLASSTDGN